MDRISRRSQGPERVRFGKQHRIYSYLLFADDFFLFSMYWAVCSRKCEAAGMRISKRVACPLPVGGEVLPQVEEFKYLGVLFTSEGKMEREIDRRIGAASCSYAVGVCRTVVVRRRS
ncbi:hypothetical protein L3Q82_001889 [Scortum barcoo]|uniref:Uncharacterized protein n=1 Tax=Scortum barcoo TaxID=214431 RepID=A0ACB8W4Y1_9TELE|nr:hypothetical protein L3Q82_001889 [Scortum barcoo]